MRTFVFISGIPEFVLQPSYTDSGAAGADGKEQRRKANRDPRYERLRRLLADHSSGLMLVMHLESKGYGLALYASEQEALEACRATITPEQPGMQFPPLTLRIVEREKPMAPEPVYTPNITIEGEEVPKASLAVTRGLDLAYRGRSVPKWCSRTAEGKDCPFGMSCHRIHKAAVQRTVRKRPRIDTEGTAAGGSGLHQLSAEEVATVSGLVRNIKAAEEVLVPPALRPTGPSLYVPVTVHEVEALLSPAGHTHVAELASKVQAALDHTPEGQQLKRAMAAGGRYFLRFSFAGGSPWDWAVQSGRGLAELRRRCPLPANGAPTPLERDLLCQKLLFHMNCLNAFSSPEEAVDALRSSANVAQGFARFKRSCGGGGGDDGACEEDEAEELGTAGTSHKSRRNEQGPVDLYLVVRPWLSFPTVGCEASAFLERGGRRVCGVVQRYGQLRLMIPALPLYAASHDISSSATAANNLAEVNQELDRFVILGAGQDEVAEAALEEELRRRGRLFTQAVESLQRHTSALSQGENASLPSGAAWCAQLAVEVQRGGVNGTRETEKVVVLSFKPYQRALEECPMYTHLTNSATAAGNSTAAVVEVSWNTQKHAYVPLFSREVFEKLKV